MNLPASVELKRISYVLEEYAKQSGEFTLVDFGEGMTSMPQTDGGGSYLTSTITFPMLKGEGKPTNLPKHWPHDGSVTDLGNGWFVTSVNITMFTTAEELIKALRDAEKKLTDARDAKAKLEADQKKAMGQETEKK